MKHPEAIRHFNGLCVKGMLRNHVGTLPAEFLEQELEGMPHDRRRSRLVWRSRHDQRLIRTSTHWNLNEIQSR
jgi:hypothetical protein